MSSRPPLPPVARLIEPTVVPVHEPSTLPGWVAALIYLACTVVLVLVVAPRLV